MHCGGLLGSANEAGGVSFDSRSQTLTVGQVKMHVKQGDITKEKVDAIVNSTNERLDMTGGMYSLLLLLNTLIVIHCQQKKCTKMFLSHLPQNPVDSDKILYILS